MAAIYFIFSLLFIAGVAHPVHYRDNSTRCKFPTLPTGHLAIGKTISVPGECMQITCHEDLSISGLVCPTYLYTSDCRLSDTDYYKEFPDCCPQIMCNFEKYRVN